MLLTCKAWSEMALPVDKVNIVEDKNPYKNMRFNDPYIDRRSGEDRRDAYDLDYFPDGGIERRSGKERRQQNERRDDWARISKWSSVLQANIHS